MSRCPITGSAVITRLRGEHEIRWDQTDPEIHVAVALLADPDAKLMIEQKYEIGEYCAHEPDTVHARLKSGRG